MTPTIASSIVRSRASAHEWLGTVLSDRRVTSGAKNTAAALKDHLNYKTGQLFPSLERLADRTGQTVRGVTNQIALLKKLGYLSWISGRGQVSNRYTLHRPCDVAVSPVQVGVELPFHMTNRQHGNSGGAMWKSQRSLYGTAVPPNLENLEKPLVEQNDSYGPHCSHREHAVQIKGWGLEECSLRRSIGDQLFRRHFGHVALQRGEINILTFRTRKFAENIENLFSAALDTAFGEMAWKVESEQGPNATAETLASGPRGDWPVTSSAP